MAKLTLYTGISCPKCPKARELLRQVAMEAGLVEGRDFVEKLIDGESIKTEQIMEIEGQRFHIVQDESKITPEITPCIVAGQDFSLEALMFQIASVPSLVLDEQTIFKGDVPTKEQLIARIRGI